MGKWTRWAIFILLALPFSVIRFIFDPEKIPAGSELNWDAIPWVQMALLIGLGIILSFFISGYIVRIYRGVQPAPDFTGWTELFIDGIRLALVWFLWFLPIFIMLIAGIVIAYASYVSTWATSAEVTAGPNITLLITVLLILLVGFVLFVIVTFFGIIGAVRFARTGSIREGIRVSQILKTIRTMGWLLYILSLIVFVIITAIYGIISAILSFIPYIGWVLAIAIDPFFSIFFARYFTLVYNQGEPQPVPAAPAV
ncbi:MAG: DUF4013 domain-containing protein [Methanoregula sp.]